MLCVVPVALTGVGTSRAPRSRQDDFVLWARANTMDLYVDSLHVEDPCLPPRPFTSLDGLVPREEACL